MALRERILFMGVMGVGKSYQWLCLARAIPQIQFRCIDTDMSIEYMLATQFSDLKNVTVYNVFDWPDYRKALKDLMEAEKEGDFAILEMADNAWQAVQRYYVSQIHDSEMGDYFLEARKKAKDRAAKPVYSDAFSGEHDWVVINRMYDDFINPLVYRLKSHLLITTRPEALAKKEDPDTQVVFGEFGVKPAGQKKLGHQVHTVFLLTHGKEGWFIRTAKERAGRSWFDKTPLRDFRMQYLVAKANWPLE